jgi:hypothetical protein
MFSFCVLSYFLFIAVEKQENEIFITSLDMDASVFYLKKNRRNDEMSTAHGNSQNFETSFFLNNLQIFS